MGKRDRRKYDSKGRDQINIERADNVLLQSQAIDRSDEEDQLLETVRQKVESRLSQQLHNAVNLNLQKQMQPQQVRPWSMEVKVAIEQPNQLLPPETTIEQVFDRCKGHLLILGEPGAGKTTSLLDLALQLVVRAENDPKLRVPVVVDLSDWQPTAPQSSSAWSRISTRFPQGSRKQAASETLPNWSFADFVVVKVRAEYKFSLKQIEKWIEQRRLIPLLDGLDEVRPEYQQDCVRAIQQWLNSDSCPRQVAICCRREQYEAYSEKLELDVGGAVYLQDLTDEQIQTFLQDAEKSDLWESLAADNNLLSLIRKPLLLSMTIIAYERIDPVQWKQATLMGDRLNLLLDAYIQKKLTEKHYSRFYQEKQKPSPKQSQKWLEILALQLLQDSETDFLIEKMQPRWLSTPQKCVYILILGLIIGLIVGFLGIFYESIVVIINGILVGSFILLNEWSLLDNRYSIKPPGAIRVRVPTLFQVSWGILGSIFLCIIANFTIGITNEHIIPLAVLPFSALFSSMILSSKIEFDDSKISDSGINNSIKNIVISSLFCVVLFICAYGFALHYQPRELFFKSYSFKVTVMGCLFAFFTGADGFLIKHLSVRLILSCTSSTPPNYTKFLNYTTDRLLLHRVGKRYRFMHDLIGEYLAQNRINKYSALIDARTFARCGESYRLKGQNEIAVQNFNRAIELDPKYRWAIGSRGETYRLIGQYEEALKDFDSALELNPKIDWVISNRGETYRLMGRYEEALKDFNSAIELNPKDDWAMDSRVRVYRELKCYDDATQDYTRLIELDAENYEAFAGRGETYSLMGWYEEALKDFDSAIELNPKDDWAISGRGNTYYLMGRYEEALKDYDSAIELNPKNVFMVTIRGITYRSMGQYEEALKDFDSAIELDTKYYFAISSRGITYRSMGQYEEALKDFDSAIEFNSKDDWVIAGRGETYRLMGQYEEALKDFDSAIEINPKNDWAISSRGITYRSMGQYEEALKDFDSAIELNPKDDLAIRYRGEVHLMFGRYDLALKDLNEAIELDSKCDFYFYYRAIIYFALHQLDLGKADLDSAIEIATKKHTENPADCNNTFNLAIYYLVAAEIPTAQNFYQIALQHNPSGHDIRDAIRDLEDLFKVLNDVPSAQQMIEELKQHLK